MKSWLNRPIVLSILTSIIASLLVSGIQYLLSLKIADSTLSAFLAALLGLLIFSLAVQLQILNPITFLGSRYLNKHTGITTVYTSLEDAFEDLKANFAKAKRIDLLIHIGRQEFGIKEALFTEILETKMKTESDLEFRCLHMNEASPYLSESRAKRLGKRREKWLEDIAYVRSQLLQATGGMPNARVALHSEPYVWRLFIFDDCMFVSGYLHTTKNDKKAPVYKIKEGESSLYTAFKNYYNHLWFVYSSEKPNE